MPITLEPELEAFAESRARDEGLPDASAYVAALLDGVRRAPSGRKDDPQPMTKGDLLIERLRNAKTNGIDLDEIIEMNRRDM